jgi:hypothetical protein
MNKSIIKREVEDLLRKKDFQSLLELCDANRQYWQEVRYRLYDLDEVLRWSAIGTVAKHMKKWWDSGNEEKVRIYIRTLFWSLNDESGGIGWSSAQTIAEIIAQLPVLTDPYGSMLIAHCIDEPPLLKGCFWGIGRLGGLIRETVKVFKNEILEACNTGDIEVLGTAAWALGEAGLTFAVPFLQKLISRSEQVTIYIDGNFSEKSLGEWAEEALMKIKKAG